METEPGGGGRSFIIRLLALLPFVLPTMFLEVVAQKVIHEVVGHGLVTQALGGKFSGFQICLTEASVSYRQPPVNCSPFQQALIGSSGTAVNVIFGLTCLWLARWLRRESFLRLALVVFAAASLLKGLSMAFWGSFPRWGFGELKELFDFNPAASFRWSLIAASAAGLVTATFILNLCIFQFLEAWLGTQKGLAGNRRFLTLALLGVLGSLGWWIPDGSHPGGQHFMRFAGSLLHLGSTSLLLLRAPRADLGRPPIRAAILPSMVSWGATLAVLAVAIVPTLSPWAPRPIPSPVPEPNGQRLLVEAGGLCDPDSKSVVSIDEEVPTLEQLQEVVKRNSAAIELARRGLSLECRVPIEVGMGEELKFTDAVMSLGQLRYAFLAASRLALREEDPKRASDFAIDVVRLGVTGTRGGVLVHFLISCGLQRAGLQEVHRLARGLGLAESENALSKLSDLAERRESVDEAISMENKYFPVLAHQSMREQIKCGCFMRVWDNSTFLLDYKGMERGCITLWHLLLTELSIRVHEARTGRLPESLDAVSPAIPGWMFEDPYDAAKGRLIYRPDAVRYALYSVGPNHQDDGGGAAARADEDEAVDDISLDG